MTLCIHYFPMIPTHIQDLAAYACEASSKEKELQLCTDGHQILRLRVEVIDNTSHTLLLGNAPQLHELQIGRK